MAELFFGDYRFDTRRLLLEGPEGPVEVRPKTLELLTYLIQHHNRFVPRDELMEHLWSEVTVTASSLTQCISELRQALGDSPNEPRYVETRVKLGYRFVAAVYHRPTERLEPLPPPPEPPKPEPKAPRGRGFVPLVSALAAAVILTALTGWWFLAHEQSLPPSIVVIPPISFDTGAGDSVLALAQHSRREIFARLVDLSEVTVTADPGAGDGASGLQVDLLCHRLSPNMLELSVALRRLDNGETVWGWTWTTQATGDDHHRVTSEVADRVVTAVRARLE